MGEVVSKVSFVARIGDNVVEGHITSKRADTAIVTVSETIMVKGIEIVNAIEGNTVASVTIIDIVAKRVLLQEEYQLNSSETEMSSFHEFKKYIKFRGRTPISIHVEMNGDATYTYAQSPLQPITQAGLPLLTFSRTTHFDTEREVNSGQKVSSKMTKTSGAHYTHLITGLQYTKLGSRFCC